MKSSMTELREEMAVLRKAVEAALELAEKSLAIAEEFRDAALRLDRERPMPQRSSRATAPATIPPVAIAAPAQKQIDLSQMSDEEVMRLAGAEPYHGPAPVVPSPTHRVGARGPMPGSGGRPKKKVTAVPVPLPEGPEWHN